MKTFPDTPSTAHDPRRPLPDRVDTLIVGAGLAGSTAALYLSQSGTVSGSVLLVDGREPASGASGMGAGMINPLMGRKANPFWRAPESLSAFRELETLIGVDVPAFDQTSSGILRPAASPEQALPFEQSAHEHADLGRWVPAQEAKPRWPWLQGEFGVLEVVQGRSIPIAAWNLRLAEHGVKTGVLLRLGHTLEGWDRDSRGVRARFQDGTDVLCGRLLLCPGAGFDRLPELGRLNLHRVKGQAVRILRPEDLPPIPPVSSGGYIVDEEDTLFIGSSYEHDFDSDAPDRETGQRLLSRAAHVIPALQDAAIIEGVAGIRVTVPGTRLPMVGPLPGDPDVWVFCGLGSKGLAMSALISRSIPDYFRNPSSIPSELRVAQRPAIL